MRRKDRSRITVMCTVCSPHKVPAAPGGARSYLKDGQLSGGFAVVAYPVEYEQSGVQTFMINQDGVVYQKDLGSKTGELARAIKAFNPDSTWSKVD